MVPCGTAKLHCKCPVVLVYKPPHGGGWTAAQSVFHLLLELNKQDAILNIEGCLRQTAVHKGVSACQVKRKWYNQDRMS